MEHDLFISYASQDRASVLDFTERLRAAGVRVWLDQGGIDAAMKWSREIVEAIEACRVLVLMGSQRSFESPNVARELSLASEAGKAILPVYMEESRPPPEMRYQLAGIQHVELFREAAGGGDPFENVLKSLERLGVAMHALPTPEESSAPKRGVLRYRDGDLDRAIFLFAQDELGFGKAKKAMHQDVDLTLRVLPVRSPKLDPQNWRLCTTLSSYHGRFVYHGQQFILEDRSTNGIYLRLDPQREAFDTFSPNMLTVPELSGTLPSFSSLAESTEGPPVRMNRSFPIPDSLRFSLGEQVLWMRARVLRDEGVPVPRGLHLTRLANYTQHEYVQLVSEVRVGCGPGADLALPTQLEGDPLVRITRDPQGFGLRAARGPITLDGAELAPRAPHTLEDGSRIGLGPLELTFATAEDCDFDPA